MTTTGILEAKAAKPVLKCLISGTEVIYKKSSKTYNSEDFNESGSATLIHNNSTVEIQNAYAYSSAYLYIKTVTITYE